RDQQRSGSLDLRAEGNLRQDRRRPRHGRGQHHPTQVASLGTPVRKSRPGISEERPLMTIIANIVAFIVLGSLSLMAYAEIPLKPALTLDAAKQIAAAAVSYAKQNNAPGAAIAIVDDGGQLMFLERLDGTFAAGSRISTGKARTA